MNKTLNWFISNYPELVKSMKNTNHSLEGENISPYHGEGDVFTHTMMAYSHIPNRLGEVSSKEVLLATLLHDIGKPYCQKKSSDDTRYSFSGHEMFSSFLSIDILQKYKKEVDNSIDIRKILYAINFHNKLHRAVKFDDSHGYYIPERKKRMLNTIFSEELDLYELLFELSFADAKGRIAIDTIDIYQKYDLLKEFIPYQGDSPKINQKDAPEAHFVIGLPGSGKSTKVKEIILNQPNINILSVDEEIMRLAKYSSTYQSAFNTKRSKEAGQNILLKMKELVNKNESFVFDATNLSEKIRKRRLNAISGRYKKIAHLQLAGELFIKNTMKTRKDKIVPLKNIYGMAKEFSYPSFEEFDEIFVSIVSL